MSIVIPVWTVRIALHSNVNGQLWSLSLALDSLSTPTYSTNNTSLPIFNQWRSQEFDLGVYVLTSPCNFKTCVNVSHVNKTVTDFGGYMSLMYMLGLTFYTDCLLSPPWLRLLCDQIGSVSNTSLVYIFSHFSGPMSCWTTFGKSTGPFFSFHGSIFIADSWASGHVTSGFMLFGCTRAICELKGIYNV